MLLGLTNDLAEHGCDRGLEPKPREKLSREAGDEALAAPVRSGSPSLCVFKIVFCRQSKQTYGHQNEKGVGGTDELGSLGLTDTTIYITDTTTIH